MRLWKCNSLWPQEWETGRGWSLCIPHDRAATLAFEAEKLLLSKLRKEKKGREEKTMKGRVKTRWRDKWEYRVKCIQERKKTK